MDCAANSLPEPLSPVSTTLASVGPTRSMRRCTSCMAGEAPNKVPAVKAPAIVEGAGRAAKSWLTLLITNLPGGAHVIVTRGFVTWADPQSPGTGAEPRLRIQAILCRCLSD